MSIPNDATNASAPTSGFDAIPDFDAAPDFDAIPAPQAPAENKETTIAAA